LVPPLFQIVMVYDASPSDCGHRQRQSASSNPPAESLENHIIEGVFTQSGPMLDAVERVADVVSNRQSCARAAISSMHMMMRRPMRFMRGG
jgi:hypothetical protein